MLFAVNFVEHFAKVQNKRGCDIRNLLIFTVDPVGLEPTTP